MASQLSESGDVIRDEAERAGQEILAVERKLVEALTKAPVEPREWARYIGQALAHVAEARAANDQVKAIIYESRRRK